MSKDTSGPAFPRTSAMDVDGTVAIEGNSGMSLRDYFAARVLPHCIRATEHDGHYDEVAATVAAYVYADAMLAEREK